MALPAIEPSGVTLGAGETDGVALGEALGAGETDGFGDGAALGFGETLGAELPNSSTNSTRGRGSEGVTVIRTTLGSPPSLSLTSNTPGGLFSNTK